MNGKFREYVQEYVNSKNLATPWRADSARDVIRLIIPQRFTCIMFSFLHISDLHIPSSEMESSHGVSPCQRLDHVIDSIDKLEYPPSFAIITGDLSTEGTVEGYELVRRYTERLNEKKRKDDTRHGQS